MEMSVRCGGFLATSAEKCWGVFTSLRINRCFWQITECLATWIIQDWLKDVVSPFFRRLAFLLEGKYLNKTSCEATEVLPVRLVILGMKLSRSLAKQNCAAVSVTQKIVQKFEFILCSAFLWRKQQSSSVSDAEWACVMSACLELCSIATVEPEHQSSVTKQWQSHPLLQSKQSCDTLFLSLGDNGKGK